MASNTYRRLLPTACAGLLLVALFPTPAFVQQARSEPPAPIELRGITFEYAVLNNAGELVWATPSPDKPNILPAESLRLRFKATASNRAPGARLRLRAVLHSVCPSPDAGRRFLSKVKRLSETDPGNLTPDPGDDEEQNVKTDRSVSIEVLVHCEACAVAGCGRRCGEHLDHLGEGPHIVDLTATDVPPAPGEGSSLAARHSDAAAAPPTLRMSLTSVCPAAQRQRGRRTTHPRAARRPPATSRANTSAAL